MVGVLGTEGRARGIAVALVILAGLLATPAVILALGIALR